MTETLAPIIGDDLEELAAQVLERANSRATALATAESCTGGLLASLLTDIEGASHVFDRGFVVYSEQAKCDLLGVPVALIRTEGAVSRSVAMAMADGAVARSAAGLAVAITGFAGDGDPPGLVHFGCVGRDGWRAHREMRFGMIGRGPIRLAALSIALEMMAEALDQMK